MSVELDRRLRRFGTRFRLFPQPSFIEPFSEPETVWVSSLAGHLAPGPADDRMYVVRPAAEKKPYAYPRLPPYRGAALAPVAPGAGGHFDHLDPGSEEFIAAHMFGALRRVMDIWEGYFGGEIEWHFRTDFERLELVPFIDWENAHSGYGYIETGFDRGDEGEIAPFALNFDVLAHELGHSILFSRVGFPSGDGNPDQFLAFHESASDLTALVAVMHFDSVVDHVLRVSRGNVYVLNELNRIGELSRTDQIRIASNSRRMSEFAAGWENVHDLAQPLTGAVFDVLANAFQLNLVDRGLISAELAELADVFPDAPGMREGIQARYDAAYFSRESGFKDALLDARDFLGSALAMAWSRLAPDGLTFADVADSLVDADQRLTGGRHGDDIAESFAWREIGTVAPGPQRAAARDAGDAPPFATARPRFRRGRPYRERMALARHGVA